jgi:hypothetical protein
MESNMNTSNLLPDCMMPNGAEPCKAYQEILTRIAKLKADNFLLKIEINQLKNELNKGE